MCVCGREGGGGGGGGGERGGGGGGGGEGSNYVCFGRWVSGENPLATEQNQVVNGACCPLSLSLVCG